MSLNSSSYAQLGFLGQTASTSSYSVVAGTYVFNAADAGNTGQEVWEVQQNINGTWTAVSGSQATIPAGGGDSDSVAILLAGYNVRIALVSGTAVNASLFLNKA